jgi:acyl-phosphate glycerol 3-phosphate acyltransferase
MAFLSLAGVALAAYLIGAVPFGYLVARARGVNIFTVGSRNIGATNVGRALGRSWGVLVFLLDFAKGAVPVTAAWLLAGTVGATPEAAAVTAAAAAFLGHLFPVYLGFRGGKGVATAAGALAVLVPLPALAAALGWAVVAVATRYVSLASLSAAGLMCALRAAAPGAWDGPPRVVSWFCVAVAALVAVRHHANVRRLLNGTENRLKERSAMSRLTKVLHLLSLGLWFGGIVMFSLAAAVIFSTADRLARSDESHWWLPAPVGMPEPKDPAPGVPTPRKEQADQAAGAFVVPLFPWYFGVQLGCGLVALVTALAWASRKQGRHYRMRAWLLTSALLAVAAGLVVERIIADARGPRNQFSEDVLRQVDPSGEDLRRAKDARAAFGAWHAVSQALNTATFLLVGAALVLAAWMPEEAPATKDKDPASESVSDRALA